ncbi:hypothetical protein IAU60_000790 [Kwoniella sp. DSM 27419]
MSPPLDLTPVDKLEFLILVDNVIEWFSTLPTGFTAELPQHLSSPRVPIDELTGLPLVDLDNFCCGAHGLSILIKATIGDKSYTTLLDSGPEPHSIERNLAAMQVSLVDLDHIVLSHWHRDHSGGILKALDIRNKQVAQAETINDGMSPRREVTVDLHPSRPKRRGISRPPDFVPVCALPQDPTFDDIAALGAKVDLHDEPHELLDRDGAKTGIGVSGEIERVTGFERGIPGAITWMADEEGREGWFNDPLIMDERYIVVDVKGHGLVVFSSCSHAGICNVVHSLQPFQRPLHAIVGGLHLAPVEKQPAAETVQFLSERIDPPPKYIVPLHCTGLEPRAMLRKVFGNACVPAGTGVKVVWQGSDEDDEKFDGQGFTVRH